MEKSNSAQDLVNSLINPTTPIVVDLGDMGKTVTITKFKVRHIPMVMKVMTKFQKAMKSQSEELKGEFDALKQAGDAEGLKNFAAGEDGSATNGVLLKLISEHFDDCKGLLGVCSGLTPEEVEDLSLDEATAIVTGIVLLNKDFFMERVLPMVLQILGRAPQSQTNQESS
ncbi:MAG: hypothetical protein LPH21_18165 [Shewanella sp.]|nr:hypothetical protein [Shewanella sp.]